MKKKQWPQTAKSLRKKLDELEQAPVVRTITALRAWINRWGEREGCEEENWRDMLLRLFLTGTRGEEYIEKILLEEKIKGRILTVKELIALLRVEEEKRDIGGGIQEEGVRGAEYNRDIGGGIQEEGVRGAEYNPVNRYGNNRGGQQRQPYKQPYKQPYQSTSPNIKQQIAEHKIKAKNGCFKCGGKDWHSVRRGNLDKCKANNYACKKCSKKGHYERLCVNKETVRGVVEEKLL